MRFLVRVIDAIATVVAFAMFTVLVAWVFILASLWV